MKGVRVFFILSKQNDDLIVIKNERFEFRRVLNPRAYMQIHTSTVIQEGWMEFPTPPPLEFLICCSISKRFYLQWNAFDFLYKMKVYFMGGGAAGGL